MAIDDLLFWERFNWIPEINMTVTESECALNRLSFDTHCVDMSRFLHTFVLGRYRLRTFRSQKSVTAYCTAQCCTMLHSPPRFLTNYKLMQCQCARNCVTFSVHLGPLCRKFASLCNLNNLNEAQDTLQHVATQLFRPTTCK